MKKIVVIVAAIILVIITCVTSIVVAQEDTPSQQSVRIENALNQQLEQALNNGIIDQAIIDRIKAFWTGKSENEQLKLYHRVVDMIQSRQRQARLENAFFETLRKAIRL